MRAKLLSPIVVGFAAIAVATIVAFAVVNDHGRNETLATGLSVLVLLSFGAVVVSLLRRTKAPMQRVRRATLAWLVLAIASAPFAYGMPLALTLPGLAALLARLYVGPSSVPGRNTASAFLGPAILVGCVWFGARVDERPLEGIPATTLVVCSTLELRQFKKRSRMTGTGIQG